MKYEYTLRMRVSLYTVCLKISDQKFVWIPDEKFMRGNYIYYNIIPFICYTVLNSSVQWLKAVQVLIDGNRLELSRRRYLNRFHFQFDFQESKTEIWIFKIRMWVTMKISLYFTISKSPCCVVQYVGTAVAKNKAAKIKCVKTILTTFFDSRGLIHYEYSPFGQIVSAQFYLNVLKWGQSIVNSGVGAYCLAMQGRTPVHYSTVYREKWNYRASSSILHAGFSITRIFSLEIKLEIK